MANPTQTALAEALAASASSGRPAKLPSYITAGDTLNSANRNSSFLESAADAIDSVPKFIAASLVSGANQLYNIPTDIGNAFGGDFERSETQEVMSELDSDLGKFYRDNQQSVDLAGFIVSSIVPGTAGVKLLKAGQKSLQAAIGAGKFGANTGKALGLLAPNKQKLLAQAVSNVANNKNPVSLMHRSSLRTIGAGLGQNAYEALAFETAVAATLFNSPILENQDFGDFLSNVAWGAGVFGLVGGALDAVKLNSALKSASDKAATEARPWQFIAAVEPNSSLYEKLANDIDQLHSIPDIPKNLDPSREAFLRNASKAKATKLQESISTDIRALTGGDVEAAATLTRALKTADKNTQLSTVIGLEEVARFANPSKLGNRAEKLFQKVSDGKASIKEIDEFAKQQVYVNYARSWGEEVGIARAEAPKITNLIDTVRSGQILKVDGKGVTAGTVKYPFNLRYNKPNAASKLVPASAWNVRKATPLAANARYIWAAKLDINTLRPTAKAPLTVHVDDFPLMERVITELSEAELKNVRFTGMPAGTPLAGDLTEMLAGRKLTVANELAKSGKHTQEEIAAIVNMKSSALSGELATTSSGAYHIDDVMAMQAHRRDYNAKLVAQGDRDAKKGLVEIWQVPQTLKLTYNGAPRTGNLPLAGINNFVAENMVIIKAQQKLYQEGVDRAVSGALGTANFDRLVPINSGQVYSGAVPSGAGHGIATSANGNYGTLASMVDNLGNQTSRMVKEAEDSMLATMEPLLHKLGNSHKASVEWSALNARVRSIEGNYGLNEAGDALEPLLMVRWRAEVKKAIEAGSKKLPKEPVLGNSSMEARIPLNTPEVRELVAAHIQVNGVRTNKLAGIRTAQGTQFNRSPDAFYPVPIDPKAFPHFALVTDRSVTSGNHTKTLYAASADELDEMIKKLKDNPQLQIKTKGEAEAHFKSEGIWDYEKSLNDNYLDTMAHRKGVSAPHFVATDPSKIVGDLLKWHSQRETGLVREAVSAKYQVQFEELRRLGDEFTNVETSKFTSSTAEALAETAVNNPFADYIKTALAIRKDASYPWWVSTNKMADQKVSELIKKVSNLVESGKSPDDLAQANRLLKEGGYKGAAYDESMEIFANSQPNSGKLRKLVQDANSILATVVLRWDMLNAVNNAVSANVLLGAETKAVIRAIQGGDAAAAGALAKLTQIAVPGTDKTMFSATKLISNSIKKFAANTPEAQRDLKFFTDNGFNTSISSQYRDAISGLTFAGDVNKWQSNINKVRESLRKAGDTGEKWTGNKLAEEFNRFVAADVMKQMTDVAIEAGRMTAKEQLSYINTFVNRTQGNYLAAQRPMMFQGPIGQSIGLFQTYQFNLIQQLLRHVGEGHGKDAMTLMALQGTIHGMNGLPAFNAVNTHLVGTASGNSEHRDFYTETYRAAGKEAGDWLMYGVASNALGLLHPDLKVNLYTRGDINPRHLTIVPTDPSQVPIVQASAKVLGNIFNTAKTLAQGGDVSTTLLRGLEHNGLSRPLAGLAQTMQGFNNVEQATYSTTKQGNVIAANDLLSLTSVVRIAGGKPFDDAVAMDSLYRNKLYANADMNRRTALGASIKSTMIAGGDPSQEQIEDFARKYAEAGGRQEEFASWMSNLYKSANLSQANKIKNGLESPYSKSMQLLMGGEDLRDFSAE